MKNNPIKKTRLNNMQNQAALDNNIQAIGPYQFSWQPYLPKIEEIKTQLGIGYLFKEPTTFHNIPLHEYIKYSSLDFNTPHRIYFQMNESQELPFRIAETLKRKINNFQQQATNFINITVRVVLGSICFTFPPLSQDEKEDQEIKKFIFYHLIGGTDLAVFQLMDQQLDNAYTGPRFLNSYNFISNISDIQVKRRFDVEEDGLILTCTLKENIYIQGRQLNYYLLASMIENMSKTMVEIDPAAFGITVQRVNKNEVIISIPSLPLGQQKRLFYELIGANDANTIPLEGLFSSYATPTLTNNGHRQIVTLVEESPAPTQTGEEQTVDRDIPTINYHSLFQQYAINPANVQKAPPLTPKRKCSDETLSPTLFNFFVEQANFVEQPNDVVPNYVFETFEDDIEKLTTPILPSDYPSPTDQLAQIFAEDELDEIFSNLKNNI